MPAYSLTFTAHDPPYGVSQVTVINAVTKCYKVLRGSSDRADRIAYVIELALLLYSPEVGGRVMLVRS
jgi:hypothetical protein